MENLTLGHKEERNYQCSICDKTLKKREHLKAHMMVHTGVRPHKCPECDSAFTRVSHLKSHVLIHTGEKPYSCQICDKRFAEAGNMKKHMVIHSGERSYQCPECKSSFRRVATFKKHLLTHTGVRSVRSLKFTDSDNLNEHMVTHTSDQYPDKEVVTNSNCISTATSERSHQDHLCGTTCTQEIHLECLKVLESAGEENHQCLISNKTFSQAGILKRHRKGQIGSRPYSCSECNSAFARKIHLKTHILIHTGEKPHECPECKKRYRDPGNFKKHLKIHTSKQPNRCSGLNKNVTVSNSVESRTATHTDKQSQEGQQSGRDSRILQEIQLKYCMEILNKHIITQISKRPYQGPGPDIVLSMADCSKNNISTPLVERIDREDRICGKTVGHESQLGSDELIPKKERIYPCLLCDKTFKGGSNFNRHMREHSGHRPFQCRECNSTFSRNSNLKMHMLIHSGEKPHECRVCKRRFKDPGNLRKHMVIHVGKRPYRDQVLKANLTLTNRVKLPIAIPTSDSCGKTFSQGSLLRSDSNSVGIKKLMVTKSIKRPRRRTEMKTDFTMSNRLETQPATLTANLSHPYEKTFTRDVQLKSHISAVNLKKHVVTHVNKRSHHCPEPIVLSMSDCSKTNMSTSMVERLHSEDVIRVKTDICESQLGSDELLADNERNYQCSRCEIAFKHAGNLKRPMKLHSGERPYRCPECKSAFTRKIHLKTHILIHSGEKPHECRVCKKRFRDPGNFKKHMVIHTNKQPYRCPELKTNVTVSDCVGTHTATHTGKQSHQDQPCWNTFTRDMQLKYKSSRILKKHIVTNVSERPYQRTVPKTGTTSYRSKRNISAPIFEWLDHEDQICGKTVDHESQLGSDELIPKKERIYPCSLCDKTFKKGSKFTRHLREHSGPRSFQCRECDSTFSRNSSFKMHLLIHSGEKPHECRVCNRRFRDPGNLRRHMVIHTGKRPHQCILCEQSFTVLKQLKRHILHHTGEKPYSVRYVRKAL